MLQYFDRQSSQAQNAAVTCIEEQYVLSLKDSTHRILKINVLDYADTYLRIEIDTGNLGVLTTSSPDTIKELLHIGFISKPFLMRFTLGQRFAGLSTLMILIGAFLYFFGLNYIVNRIVDMIPKDTEISLVEETVNQLKKSEPLVYIDSIDYILLKCKRELEQLNNVTYPLNIQIINSPKRNAFALPGGYIFIYQGMLDEIQTEDELFALLLHEVAHIEKRHGLKRIVRTSLVGSIISALFGDASGVSAVIVENSSILLELSYNREEETECDMFSYIEGEKLGIKNTALADLFSNIIKDGEPLELPEFISSHPDIENRIDAIDHLGTVPKSRTILSENEFKYLKR